MRRPWRRQLFRLLVGSAATGASGSFCGRSTSERRGDHSAPGLDDACVLGPDLRERVPDDASLEVPPRRSRLHDPQAEALLDDRGGPRREQHPPRARRRSPPHRVRSRAGVPAFVAAGTLFAERLLDGVVLGLDPPRGDADRRGRARAPNGHRALGRHGARRLPRLPGGAGQRADGGLHLADDQMAAPRWHTRAARAAAHFVEGLGAFRGRWRVFSSSPLRPACGSPTWRCTTSWGRRSISTSGSEATSCWRAWATCARGAGDRRRNRDLDYLTLIAAKGIDIDTHKATAYVLTMHALTVLPITLLGGFLLLPAFPRAFRRRRRTRSRRRAG